MSMRSRALGSGSSAARGILVTSGTNATPIVLTITAGHNQKNGDRICIQGVTTLTSINNEWTLGSVGATAGTLLGSAGNGAFGGTAVVAAVMDVTPHIAKHKAVVDIGNLPGAAVLVGTMVIEYADSTDGTQFLYTNTSGVATAGLFTAIPSGQAAIPAATAGIYWAQEIDLARYLTIRCSAYTSGGYAAWVRA